MKRLDPIHLELFVTSLAKRKAKAAVEAQILAEGKKISHFSLSELYEKREAYFQANCEELIAWAIRALGSRYHSR
jgi:hypothetical protein